MANREVESFVAYQQPMKKIRQRQDVRHGQRIFPRNAIFMRYDPAPLQPETAGPATLLVLDHDVVVARD